MRSAAKVFIEVHDQARRLLTLYEMLTPEDMWGSMRTAQIRQAMLLEKLLAVELHLTPSDMVEIMAEIAKNRSVPEINSKGKT